MAATVVGIVANFQQRGDNTSIMPAAYLPFTGSGGGSFVVKLRPGTFTKAFEADASRALDELAPDLPQIDVQGMQDLATESLANLRLALILLGGFSLLEHNRGRTEPMCAAATVMAAARTREIGIRMALGADATTIRWLALWRSARLAVAAWPVGLLAGRALARNLSHFLFQVGAVDLITYVTSSALLLVVVVIAGLLPALRAASTDPVAALRQGVKKILPAAWGSRILVEVDDACRRLPQVVSQCHVGRLHH